MTKKYIAIIYEGEKTERQLVDNLNKVFFKDLSELIPIMFPAGENIYMLWKQLKEDEFETDLIEVIREYNSDAEKALHGYITDGKIAVVNSFPLFLLEYFKKEFWDEIFTQTKSLYSDSEIQT